MRNFEQEFLDLVNELLERKKITEEQKEVFLEFHLLFKDKQNQISIGMEQLERLEDNIHSLQRDNDILRDELDKV